MEVLVISDGEAKVLRRVYNFQRPRRFRYGLNRRYIGRDDVVEELRRKGLVWCLRRYGNEYVFLTRRGREICEELFISGGDK